MVQIANISGSPVLFRSDDAELVEIMPGDAKPVSTSKDHPRVAAYAAAGLIQVGGTEAQAKKVAREKAPIDPSPPPE